MDDADTVAIIDQLLTVLATPAAPAPTTENKIVTTAIVSGDSEEFICKKERLTALAAGGQMQQYLGKECKR